MDGLDKTKYKDTICFIVYLWYLYMDFLDMMYIDILK